MPVFRKSSYRWHCDRCGVPFTPGAGGVCPSCKQALCDTHLHGSVLLKLRRAVLGEMTTCVRCRERGKG